MSHHIGHPSASLGFTLVELAVVIAVIGVLASAVLVSLHASRKKDRDAIRVADVRQIQLALGLYFDSNFNKYPDTLEELAPQYLPAPLRDPLKGDRYWYKKCSATSYHLGADLEERSNPSLKADRDASALCVGDPIKGQNNGQNNAPDAMSCDGASDARHCYDITPDN